MRQTVLWLVLSALLVPVGEVAAGEKISWEKNLQFGYEAARKGLWEEAEYRWKMALEQNPDNPAIHNNLAVAYEQRGMFDEAAEEYQKALDLLPEDRFLVENKRRFELFYENLMIVLERLDARAKEQELEEPDSSRPDAPDEPGAQEGDAEKASESGDEQIDDESGGGR